MLSATLKSAVLDTNLRVAEVDVIEIAECVKSSCNCGFWLMIGVVCMRLSDEGEQSDRGSWRLSRETSLTGR